MKSPIRGFGVWGLGVVINLGGLGYFIVHGWPGEPSACIHYTPNHCFCEAFNLDDVLQHKPGVRQVVNTWSNLYAVFTSLLVAFIIFYDRKKYLPAQAPNYLCSHTWIPDLYIFAVLFLGLGSPWFHASMTEWGGFIDGVSMYVFTAFLFFYSLLRLTKKQSVFWIGYPLCLVLFAWLHTRMDSFVNIMILVVAYLICEIVLWRQTGKILLGTRRAQGLWFAGVFSILLASFFWWASRTGNFLCDPQSWFQPHGLLWHTLAGMTALCLYFYFRLEGSQAN